MSAWPVDLQPPPRDGLAALVLSFATDDGAVCGIVGQLLHDGGEGAAAALVFVERRPHVLASAAPEPVESPDWRALTTGAIRTTIEAPLERWTVAGGGLALTVEADGAAAPLTPVGGVAGAEQPVRVRGSIALPGGGAPIALDARGQRSTRGGTLDWRALHSLRSVSAWFPDGPGVALTGARPRKAAPNHDRDELWAALWEPDPRPVDEPRLSTTYDATGHQRRAGLELWLNDPEHPDEDALFARRAAGHALCGSSLELGPLRLDCAFFRWTMEGAAGIGRYDVLRPAS